MPAITPVLGGHIDVALSNFSLKYSNAELIAEQVAPRTPVGRQSNKYWIYGDESFMANIDDIRAPGAEAQKVTRSKSTDSYFCDDHALEELVADEEVGNDDVDDPIQEATQTCNDRILIRQEKNLCDILSDTSKITQNVTLSGTAQWNNASTVGDPIADVGTGRSVIAKAMGMLPNTLVLGFDVFTHLKVNAKIVARISPTKAGSVSAEDLASIFEVQNLLISKAIYDDGAGVKAYCLGKHAILCYANPAVTVRSVSFMKTFLWRGAPGTVEGFGVEIGRATPASRKATFVALHKYYAQKIVSTRAAYLIKNAIA